MNRSRRATSWGIFVPIAIAMLGCDPGVSAYNRGVSLFNAGDLSGAAVHFGRVLVLFDEGDSTDRGAVARAHYMLGLITEEYQQYEVALSHFDKAATIDPSASEVALTAYYNVLERDPCHPLARIHARYGLSRGEMLLRGPLRVADSDEEYVDLLIRDLEQGATYTSPLGNPQSGSFVDYAIWSLGMAGATGVSNAGNAVESIAAAANNEDPCIRRMAAWALGLIGGRDAVSELRAIWESETARDVQLEAGRSLKRLNAFIP